jgi:glycosyltransferase involved in cell wall biosynthesis
VDWRLRTAGAQGPTYYNAYVARLSVVIPTRDRRDLLQQCLEHLADQSLSASHYEVIVVDDGPHSSCTKTVSGSNVRYLSQPPAGPATARNRGARAAAGEIVVLLGDDILVPHDFLEKHLQWHEEHPSPNEGMLGMVDWPARYLSSSYMKWLDRSGLQFGYQQLQPGQRLRYYHFYSSNLSLKREALIDYPFDEDFRDAAYEDTDLGVRLEQAGFRLFFEPDCRAEHHHLYELEGSCSHRRRVGRAVVLFQQKHRSFANFKWIRRWPWPLQTIVGSRPYRSVAAFAERLGDLDLIAPYYYLRNSEAFWDGFREAQDEYRGVRPIAPDATRNGPPALRELPPLSVVVLTFNGGEVLRRSLDAIFRQTIDTEVEVILVDSGSTDGTEDLDQSYDVRMVRIPNDRFNYGYARNLGFRSASGDFIATVSQDFVPRGDRWLENLVLPLASGADMVQGHALPPPERRPFYWETRRFTFTREGRDFRRRHNDFSLSCVNMATRRDVW